MNSKERAQNLNQRKTINNQLQSNVYHTFMLFIVLTISQPLRLRLNFLFQAYHQFLISTFKV